MARIRKFILVKCKTCSKEWSKREDTICSWAGNCKKCASIELATRPEIKEVHKLNGVNCFNRYGKLPNHNNRAKGDSHHFFGSCREGDKSPNWRGGVTTLNTRERHSLRYRLWRESVFRRDSYTCISCGDKSGGNLNADHIKPLSLFKDLRFDVTNGRTFCVICHEKYGAKVTSSDKGDGNAFITKALLSDTLTIGNYTGGWQPGDIINLI